MPLTSTDYFSATRDLIQSGAQAADIQISQTLEFTLVRALSRGMCDPVNIDTLSVRLVKARDKNRSTGEFLKIAENCLIACGLFRDRLRRFGSPRHYEKIGRTAYDGAGEIEPAYGFHIMVDVLRHLSGKPDTEKMLGLALDGSFSSRDALRKSGVLIFQRGKM